MELVGNAINYAIRNTQINFRFFHVKSFPVIQDVFESDRVDIRWSAAAVHSVHRPRRVHPTGERLG
jgi:hypothetical protein